MSDQYITVGAFQAKDVLVRVSLRLRASSALPLWWVENGTLPTSLNDLKVVASALVCCLIGDPTLKAVEPLPVTEALTAGLYTPEGPPELVPKLVLI